MGCVCVCGLFSKIESLQYEFTAGMRMLALFICGLRTILLRLVRWGLGHQCGVCVRVSSAVNSSSCFAEVLSSVPSDCIRWL